MANPACTFCEQYEGVLIATNLDDGDTQTLCGGCLPGWAIGMAAGLIGSMTPEQAAEHYDAIDQVYAADPRKPPPPAAPKGRKPRTRPQSEPPPDGPDSDAATAVQLPEPCDICGSLTATGDAVKLTCDGCGKVLATADEARG